MDDTQKIVAASVVQAKTALWELRMMDCLDPLQTQVIRSSSRTADGDTRGYHRQSSAQSEIRSKPSIASKQAVLEMYLHAVEH